MWRKPLLIIQKYRKIFNLAVFLLIRFINKSFYFKFLLEPYDVRTELLKNIWKGNK
jgi:hypothetical protein